jgi:hypothetical protein
MIARLAQQLFRPLVDHWRGQHHWLATLVVSVVGVTYLYGQALQHLTITPAHLAIAACVATGLLLLVWQVVGALKAARRGLTQPIDVSAVYGGYTTAGVAVVLVGITMMDGITRHLPKPLPQAALSGAAFNVSFDRPAETITIVGAMNYGSKEAFIDLLRNHPGNVRRVILASDGGHVFAARAIARAIERSGLATHVDGHCFSACTIAFIAGARRTLGRDARLGFHRYAYANHFTVQTVDPAAEQQNDIRFFRSKGVRPDFLGRMFETPHDHLWQPDHATLYAAAVITERPR